MKTVLICIPCLLIGGTEQQTLRQVEALVAGGYRVVVACYFEYDFHVVQLFKNTGAIVVCLSAYGTRPSTTRAVRKFLHDGLKRVVHEYKPTIAHVQYMAPGAIPLFVLRRLGVKTLLATLHTTADIYSNLRLIHLLQRHFVRVFTCVTKQAEQGFFGSSQPYTIDTPLAKHNHFTLYNCLPQKQQTIKRTPNERVNIGVVLRLETIKGADLIIPAFARLYEQEPSCHLTIIGDGSLRDEMHLKQQQCNLPSSSITWTGRLSPEELPDQYAAMDIVWVPSRSEGFGLSALEAMAMGIPVIATNVGGLSELIQDKQNGILIPQNDIDALADESLKLIRNPQLMQQLAVAATERSQQFSFECYKEILLSLYSKL